MIELLGMELNSQDVYTLEKNGSRVHFVTYHNLRKRVVEELRKSGIRLDQSSEKQNPFYEWKQLSNFPPESSRDSSRLVDIISSSYYLHPKKIIFRDYVEQYKFHIPERKEDVIRHIYRNVQQLGVTEPYTSYVQIPLLNLRSYLDTPQKIRIYIETGTLSLSGSRIGAIHLAILDPQNAYLFSTESCLVSRKFSPSIAHKLRQIKKFMTLNFEQPFKIYGVRYAPNSIHAFEYNSRSKQPSRIWMPMKIRPPHHKRKIKK